MQLTLREDRQDNLEKRMPELAPWMHSFCFDEKTMVGYYRYEGLDQDLTWVNKNSQADDIKRMRQAYLKRQEQTFYDFCSKIFLSIPMAAQERAQATLLDISSATGKLSFIAVDCGFGRVISTEIRKNQCEQERLILESITENKYQKAITIVHDPISADVVDYPQRYLGDMRPDVVLSSGLLYHLTNPLQHLVNLYRITKRYAIITTQTHYHPLATKMWGLTVEDKTWITKATESVSWIPHYLDVRRRCQEVGFKSVKMVYPDIFIKNFPDYDKDTSLKTAFMVTAMALHKTTGLRIGFMRNHDFAYYQYTNMNPNYFTYICEK